MYYYTLILRGLHFFLAMSLLLLLFLTNKKEIIHATRPTLRITWLFIPIVCLCSGIIAERLISDTMLLLIILFTLFTIFLIFFYQRDKPHRMLMNLYAYCILIGISITWLVRINHSHLLTLIPKHPLTITGQITDIYSKPTNHYHSKTQTIIHLLVNTYGKPDTKPFQASFRLICTISGKLSTFYIGDSILMTSARIPLPKQEAHIPTFTDYLIKEQVLANIFVQGKNLHLLHRPTYSIQRWINQIRTRLYHHLHNKMDTQTFGYFSSLFLGYKQEPVIQQRRYLFDRWGISHFLARSGLHIMFFILIWQRILKFLPFSFFPKYLFLFFLCILYHLLSWPSISFLRALIVFLFYQLGVLCRQQIHMSHLLLFTCVLTLLYNPLHLFFLDFQLSFSLAYALSWFFGVARSYNTNASSSLA